MSVSQAEFVAFKAEVTSSAGSFATSVAAVQAAITELQSNYSVISLQAAPWSAAIQAEVTASEAKASGALAEVRALHEATKTEVEELRRRATEVEKGVKVDKKGGKWELSRPKDMDPAIFGSKEDHWPKFREDLMDYADAVHGGLKLQLEWVLKQKEEITAASMQSNPLGTTEEEWQLRSAVYTLLKRKTETTTDARKIV